MKKKVLVLGAAGAIAQHAIEFLKDKKDIELTLFARNAKRLTKYESVAHIIEGDVLNESQLDAAVKGKDIVYANLAGKVIDMAKLIVKVMNQNNVKRLIFISSIGIYDEVPGAFGKWNNETLGNYLVEYRKAADVIEASTLDYTVVRPAWLTNKDEVEYELTHKGESFKGTEVSRKSIGAYVADLVEHPQKDVRDSIGVNKPNTDDGNKPAFM
ncbi:Saccharopine dehydrogenase [Bacteroides coprosuis DSM 18011]|uniref:Saccharopine dehydrogenase n=1 Tax=Bacteroides coprosuis DSM 18011 TaxID=679937 RepID=F3ZND7_9BACE|nr:MULTISPECIES: SDR family oxidoreductase [Bacteroides]EGJ71477.1 Saccharopine dehydrogenase [Bacteroides coprosuis DSM 18011]